LCPGPTAARIRVIRLESLVNLGPLRIQKWWHGLIFEDAVSNVLKKLQAFGHAQFTDAEGSATMNPCLRIVVKISSHRNVLIEGSFVGPAGCVVRGTSIMGTMTMHFTLVPAAPF
jgi:hypothetical protein